MDKRKLIQIIEKELEELKVLSEEVAENENDTALIIDIALSKARLLCQEIELLRELTSKEVAFQKDDSPEENEEEEVDEDEVSDVSISDPELEIVNLGEQESDEALESDEEDEDQANLDDESEETTFQEDEIESEDLEEEEPEIDEDEATDDDEQEFGEEGTEEYDEDEIEEEGLIEFGEDDKEEYEHEKPQPKLTVEQTELKTDPQPGVREITIEDMDDDELEPIKISPASGVTDRPVMREIPKPEELVQEKKVVGESFQKERSLNDAIGENKSTEPLLTNGSISSLRATIGLNDRFLFIREIFANNTDKYNTVIDQLDKLETIQQAVDFLKANLTLQKNETSLKFVELLKRRFSK